MPEIDEQRPQPDWQTPSQAAASLKVSARTLAYYKAAGLIDYERVGRRIYYTPAALVEFARSEHEHVSAQVVEQ